MTSSLRLPILGLGRRCFFLSLHHEVHHKHLLFVPVKEHLLPSCITPAWHSLHGHCYVTLCNRNTTMGRHHIWRGKLDTFIECIHVTLQLTVNGLSMMSINPFASFNSHSVPDKSCVMTVSYTHLTLPTILLV